MSKSVKDTGFLCITVALFVIALISYQKLYKEYSLYNDLTYLSTEKYGVLINYIHSNSYATRDTNRPLKVYVDEAVSSDDYRTLTDIYSLYADLSGQEIEVSRFDIGHTEGYSTYIIVNKNISDPDISHQFARRAVEKVRSYLESVYSENPTGHLFFSNLFNVLLTRYGAPFFFNDEFPKIDYAAAIAGAMIPINNSTIQSSVIYINIPHIFNIDSKTLQDFRNYVLLQETFQEFVVASDVELDSYLGITILNDRDYLLGSLKGKERIENIMKFASPKLCFLDVLMAMTMANKLSYAEFLYYYIKAEIFCLTTTSPFISEEC